MCVCVCVCGRHADRYFFLKSFLPVRGKKIVRELVDPRSSKSPSKKI